MHQRYIQHKASPPVCMRDDVLKFLPVKDLFAVNDVDVAVDKQQADR